MSKLSTLQEIATSKKLIIIIVAGALFLYIIGSSIADTYNNEKKKFEDRKNLNQEKVVEIKDRAILDIDQTTAIKNKIDEVKNELESKLNENKNTNEELNRQIAENQKILEEQKSELIALKSISDKEDKKTDRKIEEDISTLREGLIETKKELERVKKEKMVADKLNNSNIDLPKLEGPLADVMKEENKELNQLPVVAEAKIEKVKQPVVQNIPEKGFFKFAGKEQKADQETEEDKEEKKAPARKMDLMMGLVDAIMVTGVDAPTNIGTKNSDAKDPLPVLLSVDSETIIANNYVQEYKDCFILGTATGNATTERAYIRLSKMSCVAKNGETRIETEIEGWVYGEDNKVGVSGHLVTKSGTLILKGLMAGVLQGIADSVSNTDNYFEDGNGYSNRNSGVGEGVAGGFGSGVGSAFKTLADFYIDMAKDLYPVIEVKGGREVQLLVKGGKEITEVPYNKLFVNSDYEIDLNKNISIEY